MKKCGSITRYENEPKNGNNKRKTFIKWIAFKILWRWRK